MPQMMPMNWFILYFLFLLGLMLTLMLIFFYYSPTSQSQKKMIFNNLSYIWHW